LSFTTRTNKETFLLGEPVQADFVITNHGPISYRVPREGVESGSLKIFIAKQGEQFKRYFGAGWGRRRGTSVSLELNQSVNYHATILWNGKPDVSHLNETAANEVLASKISTEYAFPEPGTYFIKAVSSIQQNGSEVEFDPVRITIVNPEGEDLDVWNKIKGNREIFFLIQIGTFDTSDENRKQQLIASVEQILIEHPSSVYSGYLRTNLDKFKADELKRKEFLEKALKPI
jgi:hypothetical protein